MNIIFLSPNKGTLCNIGLCKPIHYVVLVAVFGLFGAGIGYLGYELGESPDPGLNVSEWRETLRQQQLEIDSLRQEYAASV